MVKEVLLREPLNIHLYEELERKIYYISDKIKTFKILIDNAQIVAINIELDNELDYEEIDQKINEFIDYDVRPRKIIKSNVIWNSECSVDFQLKSFNELLNKDLVVEMGEGQMALATNLIYLMDYFDHEIIKIVNEEFNATEYRYPTLISMDTIEKCGYLNAFPHFLMIITRLHNDFENYKDFKEHVNCNCEKDFKNDLLKYCKKTDYCLPPTMCYYTYQQYSDKLIDSMDGFTVTSKGKSFRYENSYHKSLERLWDFTIREIVFLGRYEYIVNSRKKMMEKTFEFIKRIGLMAHCETASDPFFFDESANERMIFQKYLQSKYELRGNTEKNKTISIASFNYHETFFSKNFNIKFKDYSYIQTGCVGFGLERLVYTFLCQYGCEKENWPEEVKNYVNSKSKENE